LSTNRARADYLESVLEDIRAKVHAHGKSTLTHGLRNEIRDMCDLALARMRKMREAGRAALQEQADD
jgi:hypothetical protein